MRWLAPGPATDTTAARWQLIRVHQAFLYDTVGGRVADRPRVRPARRGRRREPVFAARGRHPRDASATHELTLSPSIVGVPQDARHPRARCATSSRSTTTCRTTSGASSGVLRASRDWPGSTRDGRSIGSTPAPAGSSRALEFLEFVEAPGAGHQRGHRLAVRLPQPDPLSAKRRLVIARGRRCSVVGAAAVLRPRLPDDTRQVVPARGAITWVHVVLLVIVLSC